MAFKAVFIAHAPDADPEKHRTLIETGKYKLYTVVVKSQEEALVVSKDLYEKEKIDSIVLCPGFTHKEVAEIFEALDNRVAVCVSRGDGPSSKITGPILQREFGSH
jgi:predicted aconitase